MTPNFFGDLLSFFIGPIGLPVIGVFAGCIVVTAVGRSWHRIVGLTMTVLLAMALWWSESAWSAGSNAWPLPIIMWAGLCAVFLAVVLLIVIWARMAGAKTASQDK
jgi:protein-S-isoprenylcysteine O-methyltransferase Ste14